MDVTGPVSWRELLAIAFWAATCAALLGYVAHRFERPAPPFSPPVNRKRSER